MKRMGSFFILLGIATFLGMGFVTSDAYRNGSLLAGIVATVMTLAVSILLIVIGAIIREEVLQLDSHPGG